MIEIHLPFTPTPWEAPKLSRNFVYDKRAVHKKFVRLFLKCNYTKDFFDSYVALKFKFIFPLPNSASKKKKKEMLEGKIIPTRCDLTNLQKLYEDCIKEIVIGDDRKVAKIFSEKVYGEKEGVFIKVFTLEEFENANGFG